MMAAWERSIFREQAIKKYIQRQEQSVLLRVISPPAFVFLWILLLLFLGMGILIWSVQVPITVAGQGVVSEGGTEGETAGQEGQEVVAVLFLPPGQQAGLRVGQLANVSIGTSQISLTGIIEHVATDLISPSEARTRFKLQGEFAQLITGPSVMVTIRIGPASSAHIYVGSLCSAQMQVGSQNVLSLLPGLQQIRKN
jgi:hypothetical protein